MGSLFSSTEAPEAGTLITLRGCEESYTGKTWTAEANHIIVGPNGKLTGFVCYSGSYQGIPWPLSGSWTRSGISFVLPYPDTNGKIDVYRYNGRPVTADNSSTENQIATGMNGTWRALEGPNPSKSGQFKYEFADQTRPRFVVSRSQTLHYTKGNEISNMTGRTWRSPKISISYNAVGSFSGTVFYDNGSTGHFSGTADAFGIHEFSLLYSADNLYYDYWAVQHNGLLVGVWSHPNFDHGSFCYSRPEPEPIPSDR